MDPITERVAIIVGLNQHIFALQQQLQKEREKLRTELTEEYERIYASDNLAVHKETVEHLNAIAENQLLGSEIARLFQSIRVAPTLPIGDLSEETETSDLEEPKKKPVKVVKRKAPKVPKTGVSVARAKPHGTASKVPKKKNPNAPKQGRNAYMFYVSENRAKFSSDNPTMGPKEIITGLATQWKQLSDKELEPYRQKAANDKQRYTQELMAYEKQKLDTDSD